MVRDWQAYYRLLRALVPRGRTWLPDIGLFKELLQGEAVELARIDNRVDDLLDERDTRTVDELIAEFLTEFGLPDGCLDTGSMTTAEIRAVLNTKLISLGSLRPSYYVALAEALGYTGVTVEQYTPAWCGLAVAGDPCGDQQNLFRWTIKWTYDMLKPEQTGGEIECLVQRFKPAHTVVTVQLVGPPFSSAFNSAFYAMPAEILTDGGAFGRAFDQAFDVRWGGDFEGSTFADAFDKTYIHFGY